MTDDLLLRPLLPADEPDARAAHRELAAEGFELILGLDEAPSWADLLASLERERTGQDLPPGRVPATFLVAVVDGRIVGRLSVRHRLNAYLATVGGHLGYAVRPAFRRRGYATAMLRAGLRVAADQGVERALVTCDDDNVGSAAVIERCGGELQDVVDVDGSPKRRYWVPTDGRTTARRSSS